VARRCSRECQRRGSPGGGAWRRILAPHLHDLAVGCGGCRDVVVRPESTDTIQLLQSSQKGTNSSDRDGNDTIQERCERRRRETRETRANERTAPKVAQLYLGKGPEPLPAWQAGEASKFGTWPIGTRLWTGTTQLGRRLHGETPMSLSTHWPFQDLPECVAKGFALCLLDGRSNLKCSPGVLRIPVTKYHTRHNAFFTFKAMPSFSLGHSESLPMWLYYPSGLRVCPIDSNPPRGHRPDKKLT
jgi:hypothetical protein